jgi:hypothetical protein
MNYKHGDRVYYTYMHWMNSTVYTWITKEGTFIRYIKTQQFSCDGRKCLVHFDNNKNPSYIYELKLKMTKND